MRLLPGKERESRAPVAEEISCSCESGVMGGRSGVGETSGKRMLGGRTPQALPPSE